MWELDPHSQVSECELIRNTNKPNITDVTLLHVHDFTRLLLPSLPIPTLAHVVEYFTCKMLTTLSESCWHPALLKSVVAQTKASYNSNPRPLLQSLWLMSERLCTLWTVLSGNLNNLTQHNTSSSFPRLLWEEYPEGN